MKKINLVRISLLTSVFLVTALMAEHAWAGNGHMLHGFGPINSSMGGAGAALWVDDPVGALMFNPALMSQAVGNQISFGVEVFEDNATIETKPNNGNGSITEGSSQPGILPSFGWTIHNPESRWSFGFGVVGIAGFRTDYPEDPNSILFSAPPNGFGRIYMDHRVTKIPLAMAYQVTDKLALGFAVNGYMAELAIAPFPYRVYDAVPGNNNQLFLTSGGNLVNECAVSFQPSFFFQADPDIAIGGSVTTEQDYDPFTWNSTVANPNNANFGQNQKLKYDLDGPLIITLGAGLRLTERTSVALDTSWIKYDGVSGFGSPGGIVNGVVKPSGWEDIWVCKVGVQHTATDRVTLRAGYNYSDVPFDNKVLSITGAPAIFKHHITSGCGFKITDNLAVNIGAYIAPRTSVTGPVQNLNNNQIGTLKTSNSLVGGLGGMNWTY